MVSRKKEHAVVFTDKKLAGKMLEWLLPIKLEECRKEENIISNLNSKTFNANYLFLDILLIKNITSILEYIQNNKEKMINIPIIIIKDGKELDDISIFKPFIDIEKFLFMLSIDKKTITLKSYKEFMTELKVSFSKHIKNIIGNKTVTEDDQIKKNDSKFSRFTYIQTLGKGQEGIVTLAEDTTNNDMLVALKSIDLSKLNNNTIFDIREKSKKITEQIDCPNIIKFYDSFEEGNTRYIVMEYAQGGMLSDYIKEIKNTGKIIPSEVLLNWTTDILIALKYLSLNNICHRDIKPDNIILGNINIDNSKSNAISLHNIDKEKLNCKLIDLGVAKIIVDQGNYTLIGTLYYSAPEIVTSNSYDNSIDLWSFGVVLYELLTKDKPFYDLDAGVVRNKIVTYSPEESLDDKYNNEIVYILKKLLVKNPKRRITLDEILSLDYIKNCILKNSLKCNNLLTKNYSYIDNILNKTKTNMCPYANCILKEDDLELVKICFKFLEEVTRKPYKKGYLGNKIENSFYGEDLEYFLLDYYSELPDYNLKVDKTFEVLLEEQLLINISSDTVVFDVKNYYIVSFDSYKASYENISFGNILPNQKNESLLILTEFIIKKGIELIDKAYNEDLDQQEELSFSSESNNCLINFLYGISLFNRYSLLIIRDKNECTVDERNAILLNIYQIMHMHYLIKDKIDYVLSKNKSNFIMSFVKNDISINYKFKDIEINNLQLRFGIFRQNKKPLENYLKICSNSDERLTLSDKLKIEICDLIITSAFCESKSFDNKRFYFKYFDGKDIDYQKNQYIIDLINFEVIQKTDDVFLFPINLEKYFEYDFDKEKGLLGRISKAVNYNLRLTKKLENSKDNELINNLNQSESMFKFSIYFIKGITNEMTNELGNLTSMLKKLKEETFKVEFY